MATRPIPRDGSLDATLGLVRDPYRYIARRARELDTDVFETRLLLRRTLCMTGADAAELFYDAERFQRAGGMPSPLRKTLTGEGGVQGLDDAAHAHRKRMFLGLMGRERLAALDAIADEEWRRAADRWRRKKVELYAASQEILTRAACRWAGVPLEEEEVAQRTADLTAAFDAAGSVDPRRHLGARFARRRAERWLADLVERIRARRVVGLRETAAHAIAFHHDPAGQQLPPRIAAVELHNVLRPIVAVSVYFVWIAHALHEHPRSRDALAGAADSELEHFVQEVRRHYPFFPAVAAVVRRDFEWRGLSFRRGRRALLDLHGTNHDPRIWDAPEVFRPSRFRGREIGAFELIPQGGGDHSSGHRCAGEWLTIALMKGAVRHLVDGLDYGVPSQDLRVDHARLPALPRSRMVLSEVGSA